MLGYTPAITTSVIHGIIAHKQTNLTIKYLDIFCLYVL